MGRDIIENPKKLIGALYDFSDRTPVSHAIRLTRTLRMQSKSKSKPPPRKYARGTLDFSHTRGTAGVTKENGGLNGGRDER